MGGIVEECGLGCKGAIAEDGRLPAGHQGQPRAIRSARSSPVPAVPLDRPIGIATPQLTEIIRTDRLDIHQLDGMIDREGAENAHFESGYGKQWQA
jgi:hypothetical protein